MQKFRKIHNITLSILSLLMLCGIVYSNYITNKLFSFNNLLCLSYLNNNNIFNLTTHIFLYSKYLEWLDTLFLHLSNKSISTLQYTHHMTTAFLMYVNMNNSHLFIFISTNCLVHIPMYWYFAYPNGILNKFRKLITKIQIFQHIICLTTILYTFNLKNCDINKFGNSIGLLLYLMYLFYFVQFYIKKYLNL
tara:strand:- start:712 stop:1287 length:576 start_codon:yes stop_codon:yes gene_type:complete